ncbi:hypothetical protein [Hymenobacter sp.]|uniref:hypothetical protein n=1 Tax=Hymenobacter sp. TaxID=1898978 RepID=UPI00286AC263|nr:hypothetical protein [Hymenobacter sp.]
MPERTTDFEITAVQLNFELPLLELLLSVERQIARAPVEVAFVFDKDKELIVSRQGAVKLIRFADTELARMTDCILTHNHPSHGPLSREDVEFAHDYELRELRAVAGRCVYRLLRPALGWNRLLLAEVWESEERKIIRQFRQDRNRRRAEHKMNSLVTTVVKRLYLTTIREKI